MPQVSMREEPWFHAAFERVYLDVYAHRGDEEAEGHVPAMLRLLGLGAGDRVLDVACGAGRYARALARRGLRVTGVDLSPGLLEEARERSPFLPGSPTYFQRDARKLPFRAQFEGAISMFTSFGYFDSRDGDLEILQGVKRALVPGGRFLLDFLNEARVRATLEPRGEISSSGLHVRMERWIEEEAVGGPRVCKRVHVVHAQTGLEQASFEERVRLYTADEIDALFEEAGLVPLGSRLGSLEEDDVAYSATSPRLVRLAEKARRVR